MKIFQKISQKVQIFTNFILLHIIYFLGIGISAVIAKIVGKNFLEMNPKKSSWEKYSQSNDLKTMY